jgi:hypothetical protein
MTGHDVSAEDDAILVFDKYSGEFTAVGEAPRPALIDITFAVRRGSITALVGNRQR